MNEGFIKLPRSLLKDPLWKDLPLSYQHVFLVILEHVCYRPQKFDDHGHIIELQIGQMCASLREIRKLCGKYIKLWDVERGIDKLILCQFVRQEVRHRKSIITITHLDTYNIILNECATTSGTNLRQTCDINKEVKKEKKEKTNKKEIEKIAFRDCVTLSQVEHDNLLALHGKDLLGKMLDILDSFKGSTGKEYKSDYFTMKDGGWVLERAKMPSKIINLNEKIDNNRSKAIEAKKLYEGKLEIEVTEKNVEIRKNGMAYPKCIDFEENGFENQLESLINKMIAL